MKGKAVRAMQTLLVIVTVIALAILALRLMFPLPSRESIEPSHAIPVEQRTTMGSLVMAEQAAHPGQSGVIPLPDPADALGSRLALIDAADASIDVQYYIWHNDASGQLMLKALLDAARRGVRVRLLLDENGIDLSDGTIAALDAEPNMDVRIFNPATLRRFKLLNFAFDFFRMNRRMHNKALIADGAAAIVGGRNIGDEYFAIGHGTPFLDLDVVAVGSVVAETAVAFDEYWNSQSAYPATLVTGQLGDLAPFLGDVVAAEKTEEARAVRATMTDTVHDFTSGKLVPEWTHVRLVVDRATKGLGKASRDELLLTKLSKVVGPVKQRIDLVSAYFIIGKDGEAWFGDLARQGRSIRVATNALNTTDVPAVHAGYARYRRPLLESGVKLYEIRLGASGGSSSGTITGSSQASLHAKSFAVDGERIFIGSFNFDPRSAWLNCEMGFVIDSPAMAGTLHHSFDREIPLISYQPEIAPDGKLIWRAAKPDGSAWTYDHEPEATWFERATVAVVKLFPVEWML